MTHKQKIKVAFISIRNSWIEGQSCWYDGANGRLIEGIQKKYPDFSLVTYQEASKRKYHNKKIEPQQLYIIPAANTFATGLKYMWRVLKLIKKVEMENDILIIQLPFKSFLVPFFIKKPIVFHVCSNLKTAAINPVKYKGIKKRIASAYANLFHLCHKQFIKKKNIGLIANGQELGCLYKGAHTKIVISSSVYREEVITQNEIKDKGEIFQILFVGRPSLEKGFDTLIDSLRALLEMGFSVQLICVGFDMDTFIRTWKTPLPEQLIPHVYFVGEIPFSDALFSFYHRADVLILPSRSEGTPRVLVEARAMGCPVIASEIGGIPTSITNEYDGLMFTAGKSEELTDQIIRLIENESFRKELAQNGLQTVKDRMSLDHFVETFIETIEQLVGN